VQRPLQMQRHLHHEEFAEEGRRLGEAIAAVSY
jgi:hypothetical protein